MIDSYYSREWEKVRGNAERLPTGAFDDDTLREFSVDESLKTYMAFQKCSLRKDRFYSLARIFILFPRLIQGSIFCLRFSQVEK